VEQRHRSHNQNPAVVTEHAKVVGSEHVSEAPLDLPVLCIAYIVQKIPILRRIVSENLRCSVDFRVANQFVEDEKIVTCEIEYGQQREGERHP